MVYEQWKFNYFDFGSWQSKIRVPAWLGSVENQVLLSSCWIFPWQQQSVIELWGHSDKGTHPIYDCPLLLSWSDYLGCWSIWCISLTRLREAQMAGKHFGVCLWEVLEEMWRLSKEPHLTSSGGITALFRAWIEQNSGERMTLLCLSWDSHFPDP